MYIITNEQKTELRSMLPDIADELLAYDDVNDVLDALDAEVVARLDENYDPTDESRRVERFMDTIYWQNTH